MSELDEKIREMEQESLVNKPLRKAETFNSLHQAPTERRERDKLNPVVSSATVKEKSGFSKFVEDINLKENAKNVGGYVVKDVVVPSIQKTILDIVTGGLNILFYGTSSGKGKTQNNGYISYNSMASRTPVQSAQQQQGNKMVDRIIYYKTRTEADEVLAAMNDLIIDYKRCTLADMCDLSNISWQYTDNKYGWTDLSSARVEYSKEGWYINMPRPKPID